MEKYGSWHVKFELTLDGEEITWDDLDDCSQEHIAEMIRDGYTSGELCVACEDDE